MNQSSGLKQFDGRRIMLIGCVASLEWSVRPLAFAGRWLGFHSRMFMCIAFCSCRGEGTGHFSSPFRALGPTRHWKF